MPEASGRADEAYRGYWTKSRAEALTGDEQILVGLCQGDPECERWLVKRLNDPSRWNLPNSAALPISKIVGIRTNALEGHTTPTWHDVAFHNLTKAQAVDRTEWLNMGDTMAGYDSSHTGIGGLERPRWHWEQLNDLERKIVVTMDRVGYSNNQMVQALNGVPQEDFTSTSHKLMATWQTFEYLGYAELAVMAPIGVSSLARAGMSKMAARLSARSADDVVKRAVAAESARLVDASRWRLPFTTSQSSKAVAAVNEASLASGLGGRNLVDGVRVRAGLSRFWVDPATNRRFIFLDSSIVNGGSRSMLLREAAHELVHAEQFAKAVARHAGDVSTARLAFQGQSKMSYRYAVDEVVAETLAQRRMSKYLGKLSDSTLEWSNRYIQDWRTRVHIRRPAR